MFQILLIFYPNCQGLTEAAILGSADTEPCLKWPISTEPIKTEPIFYIFSTTTLASADTKPPQKMAEPIRYRSEPKHRLSPTFTRHKVRQHVSANTWSANVFSMSSYSLGNGVENHCICLIFLSFSFKKSFLCQFFKKLPQISPFIL